MKWDAIVSTKTYAGLMLPDKAYRSMLVIWTFTTMMANFIGGGGESMRAYEAFEERCH